MLAHAEISYRQLDHWCTKGWIKPVDYNSNPGSGQQREFTRQEANKAKLMWCLARVGFKIDVAEQIAHCNTYDVQAKTVHLGHGVTVLIEPHTH